MWSNWPDFLAPFLNSNLWPPYFLKNWFWPTVTAGVVNSSTLFRKEKSKNKSARAHTADSGAQFFCFWVTLDIASRSPFEVFAFGATTDELQVRARKGHTVCVACAHTQQIQDFNFFVSEPPLALPPGLPLKFLQLEQQLMSYTSLHKFLHKSQSNFIFRISTKH